MWIVFNAYWKEEVVESVIGYISLSDNADLDI